jgi:hypothetical protein
MDNQLPAPNPPATNNVEAYLAMLAGVPDLPMPATINNNVEYYLRWLVEHGGGGGGGGVSDVQVNGTSIVTDGVANIPRMSSSAYGVTKVPTFAQIKAGEIEQIAIVPPYQHAAAFYGLAKAAGSDEKNSTLPLGQYTENAKSAIHEMLNGSVSITGTTPAITAKSGIQYICGEVSTLNITLPATGVVDVVFTSGTTPTVLTITPPGGSTLKWVGSFDPTTLEASTTYELNVLNGTLGVAASWT